MKNIKTYEDFVNEEINLRKGLMGAALATSLMGGMTSCEKEPIESPIYMTVASGAFDLISYTDDCVGTIDNEITTQLQSQGAFTNSKKYQIQNGKFNYEYVLDQYPDNWRYWGWYEIQSNYSDEPITWEFTLFSGGPSMYQQYRISTPQNVEVGYTEVLPDTVITIPGGFVKITTTREKIK